MRAFSVLALIALLVAVPGCRSKKGSDEGGDESAEQADEKKGGMPKECKRAGAASASDLGLKPDDFIACLEKMIATMKMPKQAKRPFTKKKDGSYEVKDFMAVKMKEKGGRIASMDVFFFNALRDEHGMAPELGGQYATLGIVFPGADVDPRKGKTIFEKIDAIGRKTNKPVIAYEQDSIALKASFLPVSVRYRFSPK